MKIHRKRLIAFGVCLTMGVILPAPWWTARLRANPPAQGGPASKQLTPEQKAMDREARLTISTELGHNRESITAIYLGK